MEMKSLFKASALSLLIASPMAMAQQVYTPCTFCGFTLGLGVGATTMMTNGSGSTDVTDPGLLALLISPGLTTQPPLINTVSTSTDAKTYRYGPMASLFVGYGLVFENYGYLGAELGVNFLGASSTSTNHNTSVSTVTAGIFDIATGVVAVEGIQNRSIDVKTKVTRNSVEPFLDLKIGFLSTPTVLVYARGGINYNKLNVKQETNYAGSDSFTFTANIATLQPTTTTTTSNTVFSESHSDSKSAVGWRAGVGLEYMVTPNFGVGGDYIYSFYPRVKSTVTHDITQVVCDSLLGCTTAVGSQTSTVSARVNDQQVQAQFIYHFGM
jgi:opacity protein-like surface antigen